MFRRYNHVAISAVLLAAIVTLAGVPQVSSSAEPVPPANSIDEHFDDAASAFVNVGAGAAVSATVRGDANPALKIAYDLAAGPVEAGYRTLRPDNGARLYERATLWARGDGSYNTLYFSLRDGTGETFLYRVGTLNKVDWQSFAVDLQTPSSVSGGDGNRIIDAPVSLHRFRVAANASQPPSGTVEIDDLVFESGWTVPIADKPEYVPEDGVMTFDFYAGSASRLELQLADAQGASRTLIADVGAGPQSISWDGRADSGAYLHGTTSVVLSVNGKRAGVRSALFVKSGGLARDEVVGSASADNWTAPLPTRLQNTTDGGRESLRIDYDIPDRVVRVKADDQISRFPDRPINGLAMDVRGDGTYNTVFWRLIDASGEVFVFRVGSLLGMGWSTVVVPLDAPHAISGGDGNRRLDWPLKLDAIEIEKATGQPSTGTLEMRAPTLLSWSWPAPVAGAEMLTVGQTVAITLGKSTAGDYELRLSDSKGRSRVLAGVHNDEAPSEILWDGLSDGGEPLDGRVSMLIEHDAVPDGTLSGSTASYAQSQFVNVAPAAAPGEITVEGFDSPTETWRAVRGSPAMTSSSDRTQGSAALRIAYDLAVGQNEVGYSANPPALDANAHRSIRLDVKGDGTYNTLFLRLRDATGEVLLYRVGTLNGLSWQNLSVDLTRPPAGTTGGNADGRLDVPVSFQGLVVDRNGSQPVTGALLVDNLRSVSDGWGAPLSDAASIIANSGQSVRISFSTGGAGDYKLTLRDPQNRTTHFVGTATGTGTRSMVWSGVDDDGVTMAGVVSARLEHDGTPDGTLDANPASVGVPYFSGVTARARASTDGSLASVNSFLTTFDTVEAADKQAALMEAAYVRYAREEFEWNRVEPQNGRFDWVKFDRAVAVASARNIDVIGKLVYSADWASSAPPGTASADIRYYPPADLREYTEYVRETVNRYKGTVKVWEVWNEPNIPAFWKPSPDPFAYAQMLRATYDVIKAVQPDAVVLNGGLAGFSESFLQPAIDAGSPFDGLAIHTYVNGAPEQSILSTWLTGAESFLARKAPGKGIWITEAGWSTCTECSLVSRVTEGQQAEYLSRAMVQAAGAGIRAFSWFSLTEFGPSGSLLDNYGLVEAGGRTKPAYLAFSRTAAALAGSVSAGTMRPTAGDFAVAHDLASTTGISRASIGAGATSSIAPTAGQIGGSGALAVMYDLTSPTATGVALSTSMALPGEPTAVSMWVYGDSSNTSVFLKVVDAKGETFEGKIGNSGVGWSRQTLHFDGLTPNYTVVGGDGDKVLDYPIRVTSIHLYKTSGSGKTSGRIVLDDLTAHYGSPTRGAVFYGRNFVTQAVYGLQSSNARIFVSNSDAYAFDRGKLSSLSVADMKATIVVAPLPKFVVSTPLIAPNPAKSGQPVSMHLITGDRSRITLQIYTSTGGLVRTFADRQYFTSATRTVVWNGFRSDGLSAPPGAYLFRLEVFGADGRSVGWGRPFRVEG